MTLTGSSIVSYTSQTLLILNSIIYLLKSLLYARLLGVSWNYKGLMKSIFGGIPIYLKCVGIHILEVDKDIKPKINVVMM